MPLQLSGLESGVGAVSDMEVNVKNDALDPKAVGSDDTNMELSRRRAKAGAGIFDEGGNRLRAHDCRRIRQDGSDRVERCRSGTDPKLTYRV